MQIAIFGASGGTGSRLTERALAAGDTVTVLLRRPEQFAHKDRVTVIPGDAFDAAAIEETIRGADVVLSALGARSLKREDVLERAVPLIVAAMERMGPPRLVVLGSAGALPTALDKQPAWRRWIVQKIVYNTLLKYPVASQVSQWKTLSESSLDWTMVMPPMLTNGPGKGVFRVDADALPRNGSRISRDDVAGYMMEQVGEDGVRGGVYLSY